MKKITFFKGANSHTLEYKALLLCDTKTLAIFPNPSIKVKLTV